eukprot:365321-Chlamydomonas_euryale.AAC.14
MQRHRGPSHINGQSQHLRMVVALASATPNTWVSMLTTLICGQDVLDNCCAYLLPQWDLCSPNWLDTTLPLP